MQTFLNALEELQTEMLIDDWGNVWKVRNTFRYVCAERTLGKTTQIWDEGMLEANPPPPGLRALTQPLLWEEGC